MNKTIKRNVVITAVLAIMLCVSLIAGATFALFTSESEVNIAVTSGKVDVVANLEGLKLESPEKVSKNVATDYKDVEQFINGGTAKIVGNTLTLSKMSAGDRASFDIKVTNNSDIKAIYRTSIAVSNDTGLYDELDITVNEKNIIAKKTAWEKLDFESEIYKVIVELPASSTAKGLSCDITFMVEAMQGNAVINDITAEALAAQILEDAVDGVVDFTADYDIITDWTPVNIPSGTVINGNGHYISGLTASLLGNVGANVVTVNELTLENVNINALNDKKSHAYGAFINDIENNAGGSVTLKNCKVNGGSIKAYKYAGGLIGHAQSVGGEVSVIGCSVNDVRIFTKDSSAGGLVGQNGSKMTIKGCEVSGCNISCAEDREGGDAKAGSIIGGVVNGGIAEITNCSANNVVLGNINSKNPLSNGFVGRCISSTLIIDNTVYCQSAYLEKILANGTVEVIEGITYYNVNLDKNYVILDSWTPFSYGFYGTYNGIENLVINGGKHSISGLTAAFVKSVQGWNSLTINDLTIKGSNIEDSTYDNGMGDGIFVAFVENGTVTLNGCEAVDSKISGGKYSIAALIGYVSGGKMITVKDCNITNVDIVSKSNAAGVIGYAQDATVDISGVEISNLSLDGETVEKVGTYVATVNAGATINMTGITKAGGQIGRILGTGVVNYK